MSAPVSIETMEQELARFHITSRRLLELLRQESEERTELERENASLKAELNRVAPFLALHGVSGYVIEDPTGSMSYTGITVYDTASTGVYDANQED